MKKVVLILLAVMVLAAIIWGGYYFLKKPFTSQAAIKIGFMGPLSGENSSVGYSALKGVQLAQKELGADNIEIVIEDSVCDKEKSPDVMKKFIEQKTVSVIGEICSGASSAALPLANENKIVMISAGSTSPKLSIPGDYFFRVVPPDNLQSDFAAKLIYDKGFRKLAIIYSNEEYGIAFDSAIKTAFEKLGGKVAVSMPFERNVIDLKPQVSKVKESEPEAVYIVSNAASSTVAILKLIKELDIKAKIFGSEALNDKIIINDSGIAAEGLVITAVATGAKGFKQAHKAEFGVEAGLYGAQAYDVFDTIYRAVQKGAKSGEEIKNMLPSIEFEGKSGHIEFDANGEVAGNYEALIVKDGKVVSSNE